VLYLRGGRVGVMRLGGVVSARWWRWCDGTWGVSYLRGGGVGVDGTWGVGICAVWWRGVRWDLECRICAVVALV